jgi:SNF2 family DNA or RNA helicase
MTDLLTENGYLWPSQYPRPFDHQRVTSEFLVRNPRSFVFNDIGTSKTLSALWAMDFLIIHKVVRKTLVIAPLSTLWSVWSDEIFMNIYGRTSVVLHGTKEKRLKLLKENVDVFLINHDGVKVIWKELLDRKDIDLIIIDESAEIRNSRTNRYKAIHMIAGAHSKKGLWLMTGSPMPSGPTDIWGPAKLVNPDLVPRYFSRWRDETMIKLNMYKHAPVRGWEDRCFKVMQPSIRFKRDDCIDLLPCTTQTWTVEMSAEQAKAYREMTRDLVTFLKSGTVNAINEAARRIKLIQLAAGAVYDGNEFVHHVDCKPKLSALLSAVEAAGNKAIVFVPFRHSIPLLQKFLTKAGLSVEVVYGDVSVKKRSQVFSDFQRGSLQVIVAHPGCMAHGLTLTASHTIIFWAPVDSYRIYEQACGRITRPGQTRKQTIIHLVCSEIERKIYKRLESRGKMQGLLLELLEAK